MSRINQLKMKHAGNNQRDFLLRLDAEIEKGLDQLKRGEKIPGEQVYAEIRERSQRRRVGQFD